MANPRSLQNLKPWKPGQTGNPSGRTGTLPGNIRALRKSNQAELIKLVVDVLKLTDKEAEERVEAPEASQLYHAVQAVVGKARGGDVNAFKYLMEISLGRIPETDYDGFTEEDLTMLNRIKELLVERKQPQDSGVAGSGH